MDACVLFVSTKSKAPLEAPQILCVPPHLFRNSAQDLSAMGAAGLQGERPASLSSWLCEVWGSELPAVRKKNC